VQTIVKAVAILDALGQRPDASAKEIAEYLGEPRSSVYRMLSTLRNLGFVDSGSTNGTYRLGLKLLELGSIVQATIDVRSTALPIMQAIHDETGETVFLCVRRGDAAVCIERLTGRFVTSLALQLGGSLPLHVGAAPQTLLAFAPREDWLQYLAERELEAFTPRTLVTAEAIIARLEQIRNDGWAISDGDVTTGFAALGAPILDRSGHICAALSISGVRESILGEEAASIRRLLVEGAREISGRLGSNAREDKHFGREALAVGTRAAVPPPSAGGPS
jgi:DNA-binding IclR family transcriptional regulator